MDVRSALPLVLLLIALPLVHAQCSVVDSPPRVLDTIISAVYDENGYYPFSSMAVVPTEKESVERNSMVIVDPTTGTAYDVVVSDTAVSPTDTILGNLYGEGPFAISVLIDDTLRFAKPYGYGDGPYLKERFEGRYEYGFSRKAVESIVLNSFEVAVSSVTPWKATERLVKNRSPVKNRILGDDFVVTLVCASEGCRKEIYSLLMKYLNLGASSEMIVEFGSLAGGILFRHPKYGILERVIPEDSKIMKAVEEFREALGKAKLMFHKAAKSAYETLPSAEQDIIKKILKDPSQADILVKELSPKGRKILYSLFDELDEKAKRVKTLLDEAEALMGEESEQAVIRLKEIAEELKEIEEDLAFYSSKAGEGPGARLYEVTKNARKYVEGETYDKNYLAYLDELVKVLPQWKRSIGYHTPIITTQLEYINYGIKNAMGLETKMSGSLKGVVTKYFFVPLLFYTARAGPIFFGHPTFSPEVMNSFTSLFPIQQSYSIPAEWKYIQIVPLDEPDTVVDILVNNGSDPGDLFKSFLGITGMGAINTFLQKLTGKALLDPLVISQDDERFYRMKKAIVTVAVDEACGGCSFSRSERGVSFVAEGTTFVALTENSSPEEGSTAIAFFRRANVFADGEKVIDMTDTENACINKCKLLKGIPLLPKDPAESMFAVSFFVGVIAPTILGTGAWGPLILAYPILSSYVYGDCFTCVDTTFGYYVHLRSLGIDVETPEENIISSITQSLEALGINTEGLKAVRELQKNRIEKKQVMVYGRLPSSTGTLFGRVVAEWARVENALPTGERTSKLVLVGEKNVELDGKESIFYGLSVPDTRIPGIIIPKRLIKACPDGGEVLVASREDDYTLNKGVLDCLAENGIKGGNLGLLKAVVTDKGTIEFNNGPVVMTENWSGRAGKVRVGPNFVVTVEDAVAKFEDNDVRLEREGVEAGVLKAIAFENGSFIRKGVCLYFWLREWASVPKEAVEGVNLSPGMEGINVEIVPSDDATPEEREAIEKMNGLLKEAKVIEGSRLAVAIVRGPDGKLYLRIYDKEKNEVISEEILEMKQDPNDPTALLFRTRDENGEEHLHTVKVEVTSDGTPVLKVDGESGGVLKYIQTPNGFLFFDPETGEWKLINGVLAPLAEAFKNGIKMTFEGGIGVGSPSGGIVINTGGTQQGLNLPFFEGWEMVLLLLAAIAVYLTV